MEGFYRPTDAAPGTRVKIEEMRRRNELGLPLWHEDDNASDATASVTRPIAVSHGQNPSMRETAQVSTHKNHVIRKEVGHR